MKQELKDIFDTEMVFRVDIIRDIAVNYDYAKHLYCNYTDDELNSYFHRIRYNFFRLLIIDAAKLYSNSGSQKYNIFKLIKAFEQGGRFIDPGISQILVDEFKIKLATHEKGLIKPICEFRDKYFAHTDQIYGLRPEKIFFNEFEILMELAFEICSDCSKAILNKEIPKVFHRTDFPGLLSHGQGC